MVILYIETNFLMSIATGRDYQAYTLLAAPPSTVQLAIPSICCMEVLSTLEDELKRRNFFANQLDLQISQLKRDATSPYAKSLLSHLEQSKIEHQALLNDIQARLFDALYQIAKNAEIISLTTNCLKESLETPLIEKEPTDNLILYCLLNHARSYPDTVKVFLSGNTKEFNQSEIREVLQDAGINKYFSRTHDFLGWLNSQPTL